MKRIVMIIMAVALIALPTMAQQQEWRSTSAMQGTGSTYSSQVTGVGASGVDNMATTTDSYSPANAGRRKIGTPSDGLNQGSESPIGDAVLPMLFLSLAFCGVIYLRRRRVVKG